MEIEAQKWRPPLRPRAELRLGRNLGELVEIGRGLTRARRADEVVADSCESLAMIPRALHFLMVWSWIVTLALWFLSLLACPRPCAEAPQNWVRPLQSSMSFVESILSGDSKSKRGRVLRLQVVEPEVAGRSRLIAGSQADDDSAWNSVARHARTHTWFRRAASRRPDSLPR